MLSSSPPSRVFSGADVLNFENELEVLLATSAVGDGYRGEIYDLGFCFRFSYLSFFYPFSFSVQQEKYFSPSLFYPWIEF